MSIAFLSLNFILFLIFIFSIFIYYFSDLLIYENYPFHIWIYFTKKYQANPIINYFLFYLKTLSFQIILKTTLLLIFLLFCWFNQARKLFSDLYFHLYFHIDLRGQLLLQNWYQLIYYCQKISVKTENLILCKLLCFVYFHSKCFINWLVYLLHQKSLLCYRFNHFKIYYFFSLCLS